MVVYEVCSTFILEPSLWVLCQRGFVTKLPLAAHRTRWANLRAITSHVLYITMHCVSSGEFTPFLNDRRVFNVKEPV